MRSIESIIVKLAALIALSAGSVSITSTTASSQCVAIITPNRTELDASVVSHTQAAFSGTFRTPDPDMTHAAFTATGRGAGVFNMSLEEARDLASAVGCDFLAIIRTGVQRRAMLDKPDHIEAFAVYYIVSGRTGRLIHWRLVSKTANKESDARHYMIDALNPLHTLYESIIKAWKSEPNESQPPRIEAAPDPDGPAAKGYKAPVPYSRIKPEYTRTAYLYDVAATVDVEVDLDATGRVTRTEIKRWAGFGLDESAISAVRSMNWRAAMSKGKPIALRFLLRYNFKKIEEE